MDQIPLSARLPSDSEREYQKGLELFEAGDYLGALARFNACNELRPNNAQILHLRAAAYRRLERFEECLADNLKAHRIEANLPSHCTNIGEVLLCLGRHVEAGKWFDKALKRDPGNVEALTNKATWLRQHRRVEEAIAIYHKLRSLQPTNTKFERDLGYLQLQSGQYEQGWKHREARFRDPSLPMRYPRTDRPIWDGREDISNKTFLVYAEEGLGDTIQFARYIPLLAARGARVLLVVEDALYPLFAQAPGVHQCRTISGGGSFTCEVYSPLGSLPHAFKTTLDTIPAPAPLSPSSPERKQMWEKRLGRHDRLRVGLVWSGNPKHVNDHVRSMALRALAPLFEINATFVSLQKDPRAADREMLASRPDILDFTADLTDFSDTAALIECLDVVITVDTSVAHLAATLGRPTWILLAYLNDWRWLTDRADNPWYPTARVFRQTEKRDYGEVIGVVSAELQSLASAHVAGRSDNASIHQPADPYQAAVRHMQDGRAAEALACCEQALRRDPNNADAIHLSGLLHHRSDRYDQAVESFTHAIRLSPQPNYLVSLARALLKLRRAEEAVRCLETALQLKPDDTNIWMNFAVALLQLGRNDLALQAFQQVAQLDPGSSDLSYKAGVLLYDANEFAQALTYFDRCPESAASLRQRARTLQELKRFDEALADNQKADALEPGNGSTCNNIGCCLQAIGRDAEALHWFERADALRPNTTNILNNKAMVLARLHRFEEAFALYDEMKRRGLNDALTDWNRSGLEMLTGDFAAGWASRESRWSKPNPIPYPAFDRPMWLGGEPLDGKTLLVHVDEGLGDTIQFARYIPMAAEQGARVILVVEKAAQRLLASLPGVCECLVYPDDPIPAFDLHCALGSLPLAFATRLQTIPAARSYLPGADEARIGAWEKRLPADARLRVGLVWSGNPTHRDDRNRSIPLSRMAGLLDVNACFVNLQKSPRPDDEAFLAGRPDILDFSADFSDLSDTAALIECLDLVITVDTGVAHLAAALGRPTWILIPYFPDYRWLLDRNDSPWYPTVRLFRQTESRDYAPVISRVRQELAELVERQRPTAVAG